MIVLNFYVNNVNGSIQLVAPAEQVLTHAVEAALFTCDDDVSDASTFLPSLWCALDVPIAIKHGKQSIRLVQSRVFFHEVLKHGIVRRAKRVNIWLINRWSGQAHS